MRQFLSPLLAVVLLDGCSSSSASAEPVAPTGNDCPKDHPAKLVSTGLVFKPSDTKYSDATPAWCFDTAGHASASPLNQLTGKKAGPIQPKNGRYPLTGSISAPSCGGGYNILGAAVIIRNEKNEIIASTTTGDRSVLSGATCGTTFSPNFQTDLGKIGTKVG